MLNLSEDDLRTGAQGRLLESSVLYPCRERGHTPAWSRACVPGMHLAAGKGELELWGPRARAHSKR